MNFVASFFVFVTVFLMLVFQMYYVSNNTTNIEILEIERAQKALVRGEISEESALFPFSIDRMTNLKLVLGQNVFLWFFPAKVSGNGLEFPVCKEREGTVIIWPPYSGDTERNRKRFRRGSEGYIVPEGLLRNSLSSSESSHSE